MKPMLRQIRHWRRHYERFADDGSWDRRRVASGSPGFNPESKIR